MVIIQTIKKGGKNHSLFILNGMQISMAYIKIIGPYQNLSNENPGVLEKRPIA